MTRRVKVAIAVFASVVWLAAIAGVATLTAVSNQSLATVGGCPSNAFPTPPGSTLHDSSVIIVGTVAGCWATYDQPKSMSEAQVFKYFLDPSHTSGWSLQEAYENTRYASFRSTEDPQIQADIDVTSIRAFFVAGPAAVRLDISICRCDPRRMAQ